MEFDDQQIIEVIEWSPATENASYDDDYKTDIISDHKVMSHGKLKILL